MSPKIVSIVGVEYELQCRIVQEGAGGRWEPHSEGIPRQGNFFRLPGVLKKQVAKERRTCTGRGGVVDFGPISCEFGRGDWWTLPRIATWRDERRGLVIFGDRWCGCTGNLSTQLQSPSNRSYIACGKCYQDSHAHRTHHSETVYYMFASRRRQSGTNNCHAPMHTYVNHKVSAYRCAQNAGSCIFHAAH